MGTTIKKTAESGEVEKNGEKIPQKPGSKGKTTKQIMSRHLLDKNDVITEEDFINLNIELEIPEEKVHKPFSVLNITKDPKDKDEDEDTDAKNPWYE